MDKKSAYHAAMAISAVAIIAVAYVSSDKQPNGCFQINSFTTIKIHADRVGIYRHKEMDSEANIVSIDRIRGFVIYLDRYVRYESIDQDVSFNDSGFGGKSISILEGFSDRPHVLIPTDEHQFRKFYRIECNI